MMNPDRRRRISRYAVIPLLAALPLAASPAPVADGVMSTLVEAGRAGRCIMAPCRIYFRMPAAPAQQRLQVNGFDLGTHAPGAVVDLGDYNDRTVRIQLPDSGHPLTLVHIPSDNSR